MLAATLGKFRQILPYLRLSSFDVSTEHGRAMERHRRVVRTALAAGMARVIALSTSLISVPLTLHYLGVERYSMWMIMSSFTAMLAFADLGIGNGLLTAVSRASGREQLEEIRSYVSSAYVMLGGIGVLILGMFALLYSHLEWWRLFNVSSPQARAEAAPAIAVFVLCFALSLPSGVVQRVQFGLQRGFMASVWQCAGSIGGLCCVLIAIHFRAGLPWLVAAFAGEPVVVAFANGLIFFGLLHPEFAPRRHAILLARGLELAKVGALFFVLQLVVAVAFTSDSLVIAQKLGAAEVAQYAVPDRFFAMVSMFVGFAVTPLWPAFGEAITRGDKRWARMTLIRATQLAIIVASAVSLIFIFAMPAIIHHWVGNVISPPFLLLAGFAVWRTVEASVGPSSMYLNGLRAVRFQVVVSILTAIGTISLKLILIDEFGITIVPWITSLVFVLVTGIPMFLFLRRRI